MAAVVDFLQLRVDAVWLVELDADFGATPVAVGAGEDIGSGWG